ncbi:MAG: hypothetical protein QXH30_00265 [Candidatus Bilamarchaeaceae archaeon]
MKNIWVFAIAIIIVGAIAAIAGIVFYGEWFGAPPAEEQRQAEAPAHMPPAQTPPPQQPAGNGDVPPPVEPPEFVEKHPTTPRAILEYFLFTKMMDKNGAMRNEYSNGKYYVLAKTTGQLMEYALMTDNKELFDKEFALLKNHFLANKYGVAYEKIWLDDYSPIENKSETEDNMRFMWVLYKADDKWPGNGYEEVGDAIASKIIVYCTYQEILSKGIVWDENGYTVQTRMDVDDLRWEAMHNLSKEDKSGVWLRMLEKTTPLFLECQGGRDGPTGLFWQEVNLKTSRPEYPVGSDVCYTDHMLRAAMYFSDYKTTVPATALHTRLENDWKRYGKISEAYHMEGLGTGNGREIMEVYALMGRNEMRLIPARCDLAPQMLDRILMEQITDESSVLFGSVSQNRKENGVEDDLDTLLFMIELEEKCGISTK